MTATGTLDIDGVSHQTSAARHWIRANSMVGLGVVPPIKPPIQSTQSVTVQQQDTSDQDDYDMGMFFYTVEISEK